MNRISRNDGEVGRSVETDYRRLVEGTQEIAQFMIDPQGTIVEWPSGAESVYGFTQDEALGKSLEFLYAEGRDHPDLEPLLAAAKEESITRENWHRRADDEVFWARFIVSPLSDGSFDGYGIASQDTTTEKQHERMLERQNDRLKEFTDILTHDLKSPLNVLEGRLDLYRETGEETHLDSIEETTERMERLVEDLLRVSRQGNVVREPEPTDLEGVIRTAEEGTVPAAATVAYETVREVMADRDRLIEVFENLFRNSVEHGGDGVSIRVGPLPNGFYIEDDGPGIPEADRETVFEHGYSTREEGTGYGLSVIRSIIGAHGWDIAITDSVDDGARFEITGTNFVSE
jgi:PAS domain S-box-containing protein